LLEVYKLDLFVYFEFEFNFNIYNTIQIKAINIAELTSHDINQIIII